jgi:dTDP-L-rhamnose 4-epimerase
VQWALRDVDVVFHLAARVGAGQSMHELAEYTSVNTTGTAVLLEAIAKHPVERLIVASSMCVYGEGLYRDGEEQIHLRVQRTAAQLVRGDWEPRGPDGRELYPVPTPETKPPALTSVYALNKFDQERLCLLVGAAHQIPTVALRLFNVYGPRQALSDPYSGVIAIFAARFLARRAPLLFEDGEQRRDFVHVRDVATAFRLALEVDAAAAAGGVFNIASGQTLTIRELARSMARILGRTPAPEITGQFRVGDIRHCTADIGLARRVLGFRPRVDLDDGLAELARWLDDHTAIERVEALASRGLA